MKKIFTAVLALIMGGIPLVHAKRPGDAAEELDVKWLPGRRVFSIMPDVPASPGAQNRPKRLKVVIFMLTHAVNGRSMVPQLENLRHRFGHDVRFALVSPDPISDIQAYLQENPSVNLPFGCDHRRKCTRLYMEGSLLYPMAFVVDGSGMVIWNGELTDLPEMLEKYGNGTFELETAKKISPYLDKLPVLLRSPSDSEMEAAVKYVLNKDPGNAMALRMRLFQLENSGRGAEGRKLLEKEIRKSPGLARLYLTLLDLLTRIPCEAEAPERAALDYVKHVSGDVTHDQLLIFMALNRFPGNAGMLRCAGLLLKRNAADGMSEEQRLSAGTLLALYRYRLAMPEAALAAQKTVTEQAKKRNNPAAVKDSLEREAFYEKIIALKAAEGK